MAQQQLTFLPAAGKTKAFALKAGETLVIESEDNLDMETLDMLTNRLSALDIQFVLVGPNFKAISERVSSGSDS